MTKLSKVATRHSSGYVSFLQHVCRCLGLELLGIPHTAKDDDIYNGMFIPKGSIIMANARCT
jgi:hypothetical protein